MAGFCEQDTETSVPINVAKLLDQLYDFQLSKKDPLPLSSYSSNI
jgi:hypothetical protein